MAQQFQVLRCCSCGTFQVQQVKKSKKWSCKLCGEKQSLLKVYGQGSGSDCRHHVQKLNLLRAEREQENETFWPMEEPKNRSDENTAVKQESLDWQEKNVEMVGRWTKYLDKSIEKQEEDEEEKVVYTDRQQLYAHKRSTAKELRKCKKSSFQNIEAQEHPEEKGACGLIYQAKKTKTLESTKCSAAVTKQNRGDPLYKGIMSPAPSQRLIHEKMQLPGSTDVRVSKWGRFLPTASSCNEDDGMRTTAQESRGNLEPHGTTTANFLKPDGYLQQKKDFVLAPATNEQRDYSSTKLHGATAADVVQPTFETQHAAIKDVSSRKTKDHLIMASNSVTGDVMSTSSARPANTLSTDHVTFPCADPLPVSLHKGLFHTGEDFDDDF